MLVWQNYSLPLVGQAELAGKQSSGTAAHVQITCNQAELAGTWRSGGTYNMIDSDKSPAFKLKGPTSLVTRRTGKLGLSGLPTMPRMLTSDLAKHAQRLKHLGKAPMLSQTGLMTST